MSRKIFGWIVEREDLTKRNHNKILLIVNRKRGAEHARKRVPRHFAKNKWTNPVSGGYRYFRRSDKTKAAKERAGKDRLRPNFVSGDMQRSILNSSRVTATKSRWTWIARNMEFDLATHRKREIEEMADDEIEDDTNILEEQYIRFARKDRFRRKRRRRI